VGVQKVRWKDSGNNKINELATSSKNKNIGDPFGEIIEFKNYYQPRSNLVKDENDDLLEDSTILNTWKNYFSHIVSDIRWLEIHTVEPLVIGPSYLEV
jgi:hypothetical protein